MVDQGLQHLLENNKAWSNRIRAQDPEFFTRLSRQQSPDYLWIGCSDSRVPANQIVDLLPGELFVHRNVANVVVHTDLNCLSVIQFAVEVLRVRHIIVCGHYGCGGVTMAYREQRVGLADTWLRHVYDVRQKHWELLSAIKDESAAISRLCELNVIEQVANVAATHVVRDAWERGQELSIHGWIYHLEDGLIRDLQVTVSDAESSLQSYQRALTS
jgi:carbonic anhydrase